MSGQSCTSRFSLPLAYNLQIHPANGKQARVAEEIYQTLLSNRKPGHSDKVNATHIMSQPSSAFTVCEEIHQIDKLEEHLI
jgi:hypothetical protein